MGCYSIYVTLGIGGERRGASSSHLEHDTPGLFGRGKNPREETIERGGEQLNATAVENVGYSLCWPFVESLCARDRNNKAKPRQQQQKQPVSHTHTKKICIHQTQKRKKRRNEYSTPRDRRSHLLKR
jgi:hypothetical protein